MLKDRDIRITCPLCQLEQSVMMTHEVVEERYLGDRRNVSCIGCHNDIIVTEDKDLNVTVQGGAKFHGKDGFEMD